jgi:transketolase
VRALEQIRNDVCYMDNPVVIVSVGAGYSYGSQGYTHHALEDIAVMRALPGMEVLTPADPYETVALTKYLVSTKRPSYLRLGRSGEKQLNSSAPTLKAGELNALLKGNDGSILFTGAIGTLALQAQETLKSKGKNVSVYSVPFLSSLKPESLKEVAAIGPIVTIEEHSTRGGLGSALLELASISGINADIRIMGVSQHNLAEIGDQTFLRTSNGLTIEKIVEKFNF